MTRYLIPLLLMLAAATGCGKKKDPLPTTMTVVLDAKTMWTSANVVTDNKGTGTVYITGTSADGSSKLDIALAGFEEGKKTYTIDYRGPGGNITGNTVSYLAGSNAIMARTGKIVVTEVTGTLIKGTFTGIYQQNRLEGSFTAPLR